jgi:integrase
MATIKRVRRKSGSAFKAVVRHRGLREVTKTFTRKSDARAWAKRVEADIETLRAHGNQNVRRLTLTELIDAYLDAYAGRDPKLPGRLHWWRESIGHMRLIDIDTEIVREQLRALEHGKKRKPATINRYRAAISAVFKWGIAEKGLPVNPVRGIDQRTENNNIVRYLNDDERQRLLEACKESSWDRLYLLVLMAISTGGRKSELLSLRWENVDFERRTALLERTKNGDQRQLFFTEQVMTELRRFREIGNGLVFHGVRRPDRPMTVQKPWAAALKRAGISEFRFHDLRHTFASGLAMNGATLVQIAELCGHRSIITAKRYAYLSAGHKQALVDQVWSDA